MLALARATCACALASSLWLTAATASADPLELAWDAPDGCPSAAAVRAEVKRLVGGWQERASASGGAETDLPSRRRRLRP
ncbi:MAG: hypothetical protein ACODAU_09060, partial [Myxococcota bacterium]